MSIKTFLKPIVGASVVLAPVLAVAQQSLAETEELSGDHVMGIVMGGLGMLFVLGVLCMVFYYSYVNQARLVSERNELIEKYLQAGQPVPTEMFTGPIDQRTPGERAAELRTRSYRRGVLLLGWAIAIASIFYIGFETWRASSWGLLFLALSIASFINGRYFSGVRPRDNGN